MNESQHCVTEQERVFTVVEPPRHFVKVGRKMPGAPLIAHFAMSGPSQCTKLVYNDVMPVTKHVRRSVSLPAPIAKQVDRMAKSQRLSDNRVLVELIELGIEARKQKEKAFFELAERFRSASDPAEAKQLGDELGRLVFGE